MRLILLTILCFFSAFLNAQKSERETIEKALLQYETLDRNPQLVLLEGLLDKSENSFTKLDTTLAKVYGALAQWHKKELDHTKALRYFKAEENILRSADKPASLARALTDKAECFFFLKQSDRAEKNINQSIQINKGLSGSNDFNNYKLLSRILYAKGSYDLQVDYASSAYDLATTPEEKCIALYEMSRGNIWLGNTAAYQESIEKQLQISKDYGLSYYRGQAYYCLAWQKAEVTRRARWDYRRQVRPIERSTILTEKEKEIKIEKLRKLRRPAVSIEAIKYYDKAIAFFLKSDNENRHSNIAFCYSGMGIQYENIDKPDLSIQYAKLAVSESDKYYGQEYKLGTATHYHNLAVRYIRNKDRESGIRQLQNAIKCLLEDPDFSDVRRVISVEDFYSVPVKWDLLRSMKDKALCYAELYVEHENMEDAINAEKHMNNALELIDIMRAELSTDDAKVFWRRKTRSYYNYIVEISNWLDDEEKILKYMEKSRSLLLLDELNHKDALDLIPADLAEREKYLREDFSASSKNKDVTKYAAYIGFLDSLKTAYPHYYEYKFQIATPTIKEVQENLVSDSSQIVQYFLTGDSLFIHSITKQETELFHTKQPKELRQDINRMNSLLGNKDSLEYQENYKEFLALSHNLYGVLVDSLSYKAKQLIVIGDGAVNNLSFDALVKEIRPDGTPLYMIEDHIVSFAPSLSVLMKLRDKNDFDNLLVVSPERFNALNLAPMVQSQDEIDLLSNLSDTKTLRAEQATLHNFVEASPEFDVIHFSSHSGLDSLRNPWIAFNDAKISLKEIYKLNLDASLVTLSSCKSSEGKRSDSESFDGESFAEGVNGLARAFLFADASAVIGSNWELNESAGLEVLTDFYKGVKKNKSKAESLREAKLKFIASNEYKSPYYWAPLVLIGDPGALESNTKQSHLGLVLFFLGILMIGFAIKKFV